MRFIDERGQVLASGGPTDSSSAAHPLDNVIWRALTTRNRNLAEGDDLALRYPTSIAPFAAMLVSTLTRSIASRGETSFLHVFNSNHAAIELYRKLGFVLRRHMHLAVLMRASGDPRSER
jgi:FR47-like protein